MRRRVSFAVAGGLWLTVLGFGACFEGTAGEEGHFTFHDLTKRPTGDIWGDEDQQIAGALALGATLRLRVRDDGAAFTPDGVSSSDPAVLAVVRNDGEGLVVRGERAGVAKLTVRRGDVSDSLTLRVAEVGQTVLHFFPIGEFVSDQPGLDVPELLLLPEAKVWGFIEQRDADGARLTGFGATPCTAGAGGGSVSMAADSDRFTLHAPADEGTMSLTCGATTQELPVVAVATAVKLEAFDFLHEQFGPTFADIDVGETLYLVFIARDAEDRIVQGSAGQAVTLVIPEASTALVEQKTDLGSPELNDLLFDSRATAVTVAGPGSHPLTATWQGLSLEVTLTVGGASAQ